MGINTSGFLIEQTDESADWKCQVPQQDLKCLEVCLGSHPKDQHPQLWLQKKDLTVGLLLFKMSLLSKVKQKSEHTADGSGALRLYLLKSPQCLQTRKVFKMLVKIHLPANKGLHDVPSYEWWNEYSTKIHHNRLSLNFVLKRSSLQKTACCRSWAESSSVPIKVKGNCSSAPLWRERWQERKQIHLVPPRRTLQLQYNLNC